MPLIRYAVEMNFEMKSGEQQEEKKKADDENFFLQPTGHHLSTPGHLYTWGDIHGPLGTRNRGA